MSGTAWADPKFSLVSPLVAAADVESGPITNSPAPLRDRWERVLEELRGFRELRDDWDGQGARAPDLTNVASATAWVEGMRHWPQALPPDQVAPGVAGEVYLVWQSPGWLLEAEICEPNRIEWMLAAEGRPARQWETNREVIWLVASLSENGRSQAPTVQP